MGERNLDQTPEGAKRVNISFSFVQYPEEEGHAPLDVIITIAGQEPIKVLIPSSHFDIPFQLKKLHRFYDIQSILTTNDSVDAIKKEMLLTIAKIVFSVMEEE
ncbi:hypothetical protein ARV1_gp05 [Acidianus rod-shaped virus 1]|uniref:Uncharacterized protein n=1 Tax=Acidianus rod-shaped virus 1 TaxID=309181 RepID=Q50I66_9VIRU|nr:hypothetical protein ARV1_gp05 [Acidianus rod-shaped virus 1]CAI44160.1 hypothetical protein [Acidianus rod-shaped virus 1]